jgi:hypothetical protein
MASNPTSLREQISESIEQTLADMQDPQCVLVTREPFEVEKLAITQFPAVLIQMDTEERETVSMGAVGVGRRTGTITYAIRGFVRGTNLDSRRNQLIDAIDTALDGDRYRGLSQTVEGNLVINSQVTTIEVEQRQPPLAEFVITYQVTYNYIRGTA